MSSQENAVPKRDFQFFVQIIDSFKIAGESAQDGELQAMKVGPFTEAMTMFLRIFDAFSNPFFSDVVKKDVQGNINVCFRNFFFPTLSLSNAIFTSRSFQTLKHMFIFYLSVTLTGYLLLSSVSLFFYLKKTPFNNPNRNSERPPAKQVQRR